MEDETTAQHRTHRGKLHDHRHGMIEKPEYHYHGTLHPNSEPTYWKFSGSVHAYRLLMPAAIIYKQSPDPLHLVSIWVTPPLSCAPDRL